MSCAPQLKYLIKLNGIATHSTKFISVVSAETDIGRYWWCGMVPQENSWTWFLKKTLGSPLRTQDTIGEHFSIFSNNKP